MAKANLKRARLAQGVTWAIIVIVAVSTPALLPRARSLVHDAWSAGQMVTVARGTTPGADDYSRFADLVPTPPDSSLIGVSDLSNGTEVRGVIGYSMPGTVSAGSAQVVSLMRGAGWKEIGRSEAAGTIYFSRIGGPSYAVVVFREQEPGSVSVTVELQ